jgi:phosphoglycolate phosphatase-like HAD superfamily hydrolase
MSNSGVTLVLFDIDGTLVHTSGAGLRGFTAAIEALHGFRNSLDGVAISGRTDRAILRDVFLRVGLEWREDLIAAVRETYFERLVHEMVRPLPPETADFGILPGVEETIAVMERDPTMVVGLLTGNFARGAEIKLQHFDLWRRFRFGSFGDDHVERRDLVPIATARARAFGLEPARVVIIGDTPLDIDCAHAHGAMAVAVATGHYTTDELTAAGGDLVLETLRDLDVQQLTRWAPASA